MKGNGQALEQKYKNIIIIIINVRRVILSRSPGAARRGDGDEAAGGQPALVHVAEQLFALVRTDVVENVQHHDQVHRLLHA